MSQVYLIRIRTFRLLCAAVGGLGAIVVVQAVILVALLTDGKGIL